MFGWRIGIILLVLMHIGALWAFELNLQRIDSEGSPQSNQRSCGKRTMVNIEKVRRKRDESSHYKRKNPPEYINTENENGNEPQMKTDNDKTQGSQDKTINSGVQVSQEKETTNAETTKTAQDEQASSIEKNSQEKGKNSNGKHRKHKKPDVHERTNVETRKSLTDKTKKKATAATTFTTTTTTKPRTNDKGKNLHTRKS